MKNIYLLFSAMMILAITSCNSGSSYPKNSDGSFKSARQIEIDNQFDDWDGSHPALTEMIKNNMNDPSSYEHVETRFKDENEHILVITKFRGKNAFGAKVLNTVMAKVDLKGNVLEIVSQTP